MYLFMKEDRFSDISEEDHILEEEEDQEGDFK